jgi:hypothetical protein
VLACGAASGGAAVDWNRREPGSLARHPFKVLPQQTDFPFAAFVWCTGGESAALQVQEHLLVLGGAAAFCPALPWETLPAEGAPQREKARRTLGLLTTGEPPGAPRGRLLRVKELQAWTQGRPDFDAETLRLYKAWLESDPDEPAAFALSQRIGRSPDESCKRLRIVDVAFGDDRRHRNEEVEDHAEIVRSQTMRLSVMLASPADLEPLRRYLCEAGCEVAVLPFGSMDPRLRVCY